MSLVHYICKRRLCVYVLIMSLIKKKMKLIRAFVRLDKCHNNNVIPTRKNMFRLQTELEGNLYNLIHFAQFHFHFIFDTIQAIGYTCIDKHLETSPTSRDLCLVFLLLSSIFDSSKMSMATDR